MKFYLILICIFFNSCQKKIENTAKNTDNLIQSKNEQFFFEDSSFQNQPWFRFYSKENSNLKQKLFKLQGIDSISYRESSIITTFNKQFNQVYKPFLVYNETKNKYIDFDSSNWISEDSVHVYFDVDQQIVLVDIEKHQSKQIAFFGSSSWIEDAYWKGDSVAILIGNGYDKKPFLLKYNFEKEVIENYKSLDTINSSDSYSIFRLKSKGLKMY